MNKPKRRFTEEAQIIKAIDLCYQRSAEFYKIAEDFDKQADVMFRDPLHVEQAEELREAAKAKRTRAFNLVNKKAKYYGEKLSEFRTATIQAVTTDTSVQA